MQIDGGVREVSVIPVALRDGILPSSEECLLAEAQHPAGHRDRNPVSGQFTDQREHHLGSEAYDNYAAALRRISFSCSSNRMRLRASRNSAASAGLGAVFDVGDLQPPLQAGL